MLQGFRLPSLLESLLSLLRDAQFVHGVCLHADYDAYACPPLTQHLEEAPGVLIDQMRRIHDDGEGRFVS